MQDPQVHDHLTKLFPPAHPRALQPLREHRLARRPRHPAADRQALTPVAGIIHPPAMAPQVAVRLPELRLRGPGHGPPPPVLSAPSAGCWTPPGGGPAAPAACAGTRASPRARTRRRAACPHSRTRGRSPAPIRTTAAAPAAVDPADAAAPAGSSRPAPGLCRSRTPAAAAAPASAAARRSPGRSTSPSAPSVGPPASVPATPCLAAGRRGRTPRPWPRWPPGSPGRGGAP